MSLVISLVDSGELLSSPVVPGKLLSKAEWILAKAEWILSKAEWILAYVHQAEWILAKAEWILANLIKSLVDSRKSRVDSR
jgi:hypothetical protein